MNSSTQIDYLAIGHVSHDLTPDGPVAGGTAVYSSRTAQALGCRTAVLTSAGDDFDIEGALPGLAVSCVRAKETTTFENVYTPTGRRQLLHAVAETLMADHVPGEWRRAPIVHLAPIANEVDPAAIKLFSNSLVGLTPQGWYRRWDDDGRVFGEEWPASAEVLPSAAAVILSLEDLPDPQLLNPIRELTPIVVLTRQAGGCEVFCRDEARLIAAPPVTEVNPTGAGDVFAAAFLIRLYQTKGNPWEAGEFANRVASESVAQEDLEAKVASIKAVLSSEV